MWITCCVYRQKRTWINCLSAQFQKSHFTEMHCVYLEGVEEYTKLWYFTEMHDVCLIGTDEYTKLCQKAEELMDQSMLVETSENGSMSLNYCNAAIGKYHLYTIDTPVLPVSLHAKCRPSTNPRDPIRNAGFWLRFTSYPTRETRTVVVMV